MSVYEDSKVFVVLENNSKLIEVAATQIAADEIVGTYQLYGRPDASYTIVERPLWK